MTKCAVAKRKPTKCNTCKLVVEALDGKLHRMREYDVADVSTGLESICSDLQHRHLLYLPSQDQCEELVEDHDDAIAAAMNMWRDDAGKALRGFCVEKTKLCRKTSESKGKKKKNKKKKKSKKKEL